LQSLSRAQIHNQKWYKIGEGICKASRAAARDPKGREWGWVSWRRRSEPYPHQIGDLRSAIIMFSSRVRGGAPAQIDFLYALFGLEIVTATVAKVFRLHFKK